MCNNVTCCLWQHHPARWEQTGKLNAQIHASSWFTSRKLFPIEWCWTKAIHTDVSEHQGTETWFVRAVQRMKRFSEKLSCRIFWPLLSLCILVFCQWATKAGKQAGCWEVLHQEKSGRISWNHFTPPFVFSSAFLIISLRFGLLSYQPLSLSRAGREKKKKREGEWATAAEKWLKRIISICPW